MVRALDWHVYDEDGDLRAIFAFPEEAACLIAMLGDGSNIRFGHVQVVWVEGQEEQSAEESYDYAADTCYGRAGSAARRGVLDGREDAS